MPAPVIIVTGVSRAIGRAIAFEQQSRGTAVVGLLATFALCRAAHPHLKASRGSVVNVSSVTGSLVLPAG
jgi:NAD(P)-dependent dehydrogenase (short-subunit alcohol dehydrogenase family)